MLALQLCRQEGHSGSSRFNYIRNVAGQLYRPRLVGMEGTVIRFINFSCAVVAVEWLNFSGRFKEAD